MTQTEHAYIKAGNRYETARTPDAARIVAGKIRAMLETENPDDRPHARELVETGRREARQGT